MSKIYVRGIVGTGIYGVPASDATLATATAGMDLLLSDTPGVAGLFYDGIRGFVRDSNGSRTLNLILEGAQFFGSDVPNEANTDLMFTAIEVALKYNPGGEIAGLITDVAEVRLNAFDVARGG